MFAPWKRQSSQPSLLWRVTLLNASVLAVAVLTLALSPATVSFPLAPQEALVLGGGLSAVLALNLWLLRRAFAPLTRLSDVMRRIDPLRPGLRVPVYGDDAEVVHMTHAFNDMLGRLEDERLESTRRGLQGQEEERRRIAVELHDEVGQRLTAVMLHVEQLTRSSPDAGPDLGEIKEAVRETLEEVRLLARRLRPEALDDLGLPSALAALTQRLSRHAGLPVASDLERDLPPLSEEAELAIYRIAQEGLTNALRHSTASRVRLALKRDADGIVLSVTDNGHGLDGRATNGWGIRAMRERALSVGGTLRLGSTAGGGAELELSIPASQGER